MATATASNTRSSRKIKYGTNVLIGTIMFVVVLVAINYIAQRTQIRADLTRNKQFTVSNSTKAMLAGLKDIVNVKVYATAKDTPPEWTEQREQLRDLLQEYKTLSNGKLRYRFYDPSTDEKIEREATQAQIAEQAMQKMGSDELSIKAGYFGAVVDYKGKTEPIRQISPESSLEYQLSRAINKVAMVNVPVIGVVAPQGNPFTGDQGQFSLIPQVMEQEGYTVKSLDAAKIGDLTDVKLIMVFGSQDLSEESLFRIDQFVMNGGKLFVAAGGVELNERTGQGTAKAPNINALLESYGVRINQNIVEDWGRGIATPVMTSFGVAQRRNPFIVEVTDVSEKSLVTKNLPGVLMLYPSSVSASEAATSGSVEVLARSSEKSKKQEQFFVLNERQIKPPPADEKLQAENLIMSVKGKLKSRFTEVDPPVITNDDGTTRGVAASEVIRESKPEAQAIAFGSTYSFISPILQQGPGQINAVFLLNIADALTRGGDLIALRSKQVQNSMLKPGIQPRAQATATALAVVGVPVLLVAFGLLKAFLNRRRKAKYREVYGAPTAA